MSVMAPNPSTIELWQTTAARREVVELVEGLFDKLGVEVVDTGERLTVTRQDGALRLSEGVDASAVDYTVSITRMQAERMASEAKEAGPLDPVQIYRVVAALFTAATAATLEQPRLASPFLRFVTGAESLIHVCLTSPNRAAEPDTCHSLIYAARQWLVIDGLHGQPQRSFRMDVAQTLEYQRRVVKVMKNETLGNWLDFARWYRSWRSSVSVRGPMPDGLVDDHGGNAALIQTRGAFT